MKAISLLLTALVSLSLSGCTHNVESRLSTCLIQSPYNYIGLDLHAPEENLLLHDDQCYYLLAPAVQYNLHTPLIDAWRYEEESAYPAVRNVTPLSKAFLAKVKPGMDGEAPQVTIWLVSRDINDNIIPSPKDKTVTLRIVGEKKTETISGLKAYILSNGVAPEFFRKMRLPHYAQIGPDLQGWKKAAAYASLPLLLPTSVIDYALTLTAKTAQAVVMTPIFLGKCCLGSQQQQTTADRTREIPVTELVKAKVIAQ